VHPRPEDYDASYCDYQAEHGLSNTAMCETLKAAYDVVQPFNFTAGPSF
jgi:hypothetical protein